MRRKGEGQEAGRSRGFPAPGQRYLAAWLLPRRGQKPVCEQVASAATDAAGTNAIDRKMDTARALPLTILSGLEALQSTPLP